MQLLYWIRDWEQERIARQLESVLGRILSSVCKESKMPDRRFCGFYGVFFQVAKSVGRSFDHKCAGSLPWVLSFSRLHCLHCTVWLFSVPGSDKHVSFPQEIITKATHEGHVNKATFLILKQQILILILWTSVMLIVWRHRERRAAEHSKG